MMYFSNFEKEISIEYKILFILWTGMLSISFFLEFCLSSFMETLSLLTRDCMTQQSVMLLATSHADSCTWSFKNLLFSSLQFYNGVVKGEIMSRHNAVGFVSKKAVALTYLPMSKHFNCMFFAVVVQGRLCHISLKPLSHFKLSSEETLVIHNVWLKPVALP